MNSVIDKAKNLAIPTKQEEKKIKILSDNLVRLVKSEAANYPEVVEVELGGSYAKGTWLKGELDLDIFVKMKSEVNEKRFEEIAKKIGFNSMKIFKPYVRYSEHPYVEAEASGIRVNVVPCYDVQKGEWKSAADRSSFHTKFILKSFNQEMKNEVRLLKKFLKGMDIYGAEIAKEGFGGYVAEVLVYHFGSFIKVLEAATNFTFGQVIGSPTKKFESALVLIDPIDNNRNLGTAISTQNVGKFILASRAFLKKSSFLFFSGKKSRLNSKTRQNTVIVKFNYKWRSPDTIWGQVKRGSKALANQLNLAGFQVLRKVAIIDEKSEAAMIFLLDSPVIENLKIKNGPELFRKLESENFITRNSKNMLTWIDDEGKILSMQERDFYNARKFLQSLLKSHLSKSGIPSGIRPDIKRSFAILNGSQVTSKSIKKAMLELTSTNEIIFGRPK